MKTTKGKFILFDLPAFEIWLTDLKVTRKIGLIQQHHTWKPDYSSWEKLPDHFHWLESMENFQMQNGFAQIAQQLTSFPDGTIALGRPFDIIPAGIKGANQYGICIEHLGNFDIGGDTMTETHRRTILKMNTALLLKFGLIPSTDTIIFHHWFDIITGQRTNGTGTVKTCPGTNFFGGNKVEDCKLNFIPFLSLEQRMSEGIGIEEIKVLKGTRSQGAENIWQKILGASIFIGVIIDIILRLK